MATKKTEVKTEVVEKEPISEPIADGVCADRSEHQRLMKATEGFRDKALKLAETIMESNGKPPYNEQQLKTLETVMQMYNTFMY